jgi:hypothetical protein
MWSVWSLSYVVGFIETRIIQTIVCTICLSIDFVAPKHLVSRCPSNSRGSPKDSLLCVADNQATANSVGLSDQKRRLDVTVLGEIMNLMPGTLWNATMDRTA